MKSVLIIGAGQFGIHIARRMAELRCEIMVVDSDEGRINSIFQDSLETTALLKELGAKKVIARAQNDVQEKFLLRNGADETVYPEKLTAIRVATKEAHDDILDVFQLDRNINIYEVQVPANWSNKTIAELDIRRKHNLNIIAVRAEDRLVLPMPDMILTSDDAVLLLGNIKDIQKAF